MDEKYNMWYSESKDRFFWVQYVVKHNMLCFFFFERWFKMGLTSLDIVRVYRFCSIQDIQRHLKEQGCLVRLSMIADMLQVVFLEIELDVDKDSKESDKEAEKGSGMGVEGCLHA